MRRSSSFLIAVAVTVTTLTTGVAAAADRPDDLVIDTAGLDVRINGPRQDGNLGGDDSGFSSAVNSAGDVNGDGIEDLIIGEGGSPSARTGAWVLFGPVLTTRNLSNLGAAGFRIDAPSPEAFGRTATAAGDVNGDGFDDVLVGGRSTSNQGRFVVVYGSASSADVDATSMGSRGFTIVAPDAPGATIAALAGVGDINNDGFDDVALGAPNADGGAGKVYVVLGAAARTGSVNVTTLGNAGFTIAGAPGDGLGIRIASGDVNKDGRSDMAVVSNRAVAVLLGSTSTANTTIDTLGTRGLLIEFTQDTDDTTTEALGISVAVGDLNGDGFDDVAFVFGRITTDPVSSAVTTQAWVVVSLSSASTSNRDFSDTGSFGGYRIADAGAKELFANALASGGDVDRDGFEDLLIGSVDPDGGSGQADLVYGSTRSSSAGDIDLATASSSVALNITTAVTDTNFARSPAFVDVDASGRRDDLAFGAPSYDPAGRTNAGAVHLVRDLFADTTAPTVSIAALGRTSDTTPPVSFSSDDTDVGGFACRVGTVAFVPCTSPWSPSTAIADGNHSVEVRATDTSGNSATATATVTIDATGPATTITDAPTSPTQDDTPTISFTSTAGDLAGFLCAADAATPAPCTSPHTFGPLAAGEHTLRVHAVDDLGNVGPDAVAVVRIAPATTVIPPSGGGEVNEDLIAGGRVAGADRIETSIRLSQLAWNEADVAIVARSDNYADALASTTLGAAVDGPILQNATAALDDRVAAELTRLGVTTVYLSGGEAALSADVATALEALGFNVVRLAGETRFDTAAVIADHLVELLGPVDSIVVALGRDPQPGQAGWVDALASGTYAITTTSPLLLTTKEELPAATAAAITRLLPDGGEVILSGGPVAVSAEVESAIAALSPDLDVTRIAGETRYDTAVALIDAAAEAGVPIEIAFAASGRNYPDALSGAVAAWKVGGFLTLVDPTDLANSVPTRDHLVTHADTIKVAVVIGGPVAISEHVLDQVLAAVDGRLIR